MGDFEKDLSAEEAKAAKRLLDLCRSLANEYSDEGDE
jgi:hypothetical protein